MDNGHNTPTGLPKIDRYLVQGEIGRGGMAVVYRAQDPRFNRTVAIKALPRDWLLIDPSFRVRFQREAQTIAALEHPAIVPVYDYGEQDGQPYLVMRYMTGGSLEERLKRGPLPLGEAKRVLRRLAPALDYAHSRGVIHRDLKPGNLLFDQHNEPHISDFGLVKLKEETTTLTGGAIVGTPAYMSPEQGRGRSDLDGRADLYSLGAILFQMLSGRLPYEADTPTGQIIAHINDPVPNILEIKPDLPAGVQAVIERSMAKRREERYSTVGEMVAALEAVVGEPSMPAQVIPVPVTVKKPVEETILPTELPVAEPASAELVTNLRHRPSPAIHLPEQGEGRLASRLVPLPVGRAKYPRSRRLFGLKRYGWLIGAAAVLFLALLAIVITFGGISLRRWLADRAATSTHVAQVGMTKDTFTLVPTSVAVITISTPTSTNTVTRTPVDSPTPTPVPEWSATPTSTASAPFLYTVQEGDTLRGIADKFGVTLEMIFTLNPNIDPQKGILSPGQKILIPAPGTTSPTPTTIPVGWTGTIDYLIQTGDTLDSIALKFNSTVASIMVLNGLANANDIFVGLTLKVEVNIVTPLPTLGIGSTMVSENDGMVLVYVPAGEFLMGSADSDTLAESDEKPQHKVYLDAFWIDQTEVTNAMYALCVQAAGCQPPPINESNRRDPYYDFSLYGNYPMIHVRWNDAKAYCEWSGRHLPTEAEWEKAALGTDGLIYPWDNETISCAFANYANCVEDTASVGSYPAGASPYGVLEMAGNVWEWVADWYEESYYASSPYSNPLGPDTGNHRVLRGGAWGYEARSLRAANRLWFNSDALSNGFGFRCARSP